MSDPLSDVAWKADGKCFSLTTSREDRLIDASFFADYVDEREPARKFCEGCPVQKRCLKFALETQQLWGVWGGRDEAEIRRALWVDASGNVGARTRYPRCPWCKPSKNTLTCLDEETSLILCSDCGYSWKSETTMKALIKQQESQ